MGEKNEIPYEKDVFEKDENAPDCYELSALFFVYKFLFGDEYCEMCNISKNIKK